MHGLNKIVYSSLVDKMYEQELIMDSGMNSIAKLISLKEFMATLLHLDLQKNLDSLVIKSIVMTGLPNIVYCLHSVMMQ